MFFSRFRKKKALVIEGGGMRGIFAIGVLQAFADRKFFPWKVILGSSAGALSGIAYAADQIYLSRDSLFTELLSGNFINIMNIARPSRHILNLDWMISTVLNDKEPLDLKRLRKQCPVIITGTHVPENDAPCTIYFNSRKDDLLTVLKATAALPYLYRGFVHYKDYALLDGGILDPMPYTRALSMGFKEDEILVILSRSKGYRKKKESFWVTKLYELYYKDPKYRFLVECLNNRYEKYNAILDDLEMKHPAIDIIYPPRNFAIDRLTKDRALLLTGFEDGIQAGKQFLRYIGHKK
jgi:predicted patatin/cPLA2 family phospholipase